MKPYGKKEKNGYCDFWSTCYDTDCKKSNKRKRPKGRKRRARTEGKKQIKEQSK